jgi:hypothetical protein
MDKTNGKFDPKHREQLARMLTDAKTTEQRRLEDAASVSARSILRALAKKAGALTIVERVEELESQKKKAENALADLGFEVSGSDLELRWNAPDQLAKEYENQVEEAKPSMKKSLKKYDLAIIGVLTAETAAEAKKIAEGLI